MLVSLMQIANLVVFYYALDAAKLDFNAGNYFIALWQIFVPFAIAYVLSHIDELIDSMIE